jgi:hypothetical protein
LTFACGNHLFESLAKLGWPDVSSTIARSHADLSDSAEIAMTSDDHHAWVRLVAEKIIIGGHELWRAMCQSWTRHCMTNAEATPIIDALEQIVKVRGIAPPGRLFTGMEFVAASVE